MRVMLLAFLITSTVMLALLYFIPKPCYLVNPDDDGMEVGEPLEILHWRL